MGGKALSGQLRVLAIGGFLLAALGVGSVFADEHDHDRARRAVDAGEVLPLRMILDRVERDYPGQVMEVELEQRGERWIYEVKVLQTGGALIKLKVDGRDGHVLAGKEQPGRRNGVEP